MNTPITPVRKLIAVTAALFTGLLATSAWATPVMISFSATVQGSGLGTLSIGSVITGSMTFDDAQLGYVNAPYGTFYNGFASTETIGSQTVINPFSYAQIANESSYYSGDLVAMTVNYPASGGYFSLGGLNDVATGFTFWGMGNNIINSESLASVSGLVPANASSAWMYFYDGSYGPTQGQGLGYAEITSWQASNVPDVSLTIALLGMGAVGLLALRRQLGRN